MTFNVTDSEFAIQENVREGAALINNGPLPQHQPQQTNP